MAKIGRGTRTAPRTVAKVLGDLDQAIKMGQARELLPIATGFEPLDSTLSGGLHPGELMLVGGAPGSGKTVCTLQWARNIAINGGTAVYACYEHEESMLLGRLLALELGGMSHSTDDMELDKLRMGIQEVAMGGVRGLRDVLDSEDHMRQAYERVESYADRLWLVRASGAHTGIPEIEEMITQRVDAQNFVMFVDYLQKVALRPEPPDENEKVTKTTEALKDLALSYQIPIVAIVAADREGLKARRLRMHHLRGSSALAYEADVAIIMNNKFDCISKVHLAYDPVGAERYKDYTVFSLEKNRGGPNLVDIEHRKDFQYYRFEDLHRVARASGTSGGVGRSPDRRSSGRRRHPWVQRRRRPSHDAERRAHRAVCRRTPQHSA
jgi:replicative DNA helicase